MEISGAMGDLGTYIPIVVALSIQCVARKCSLRVIVHDRLD